jgi:UDPglucose 6-dehydrogenase
MTTVTVVGAGYVGLTTAACLAHLGHRVHAVDIDTTRLRRLASGHVDLLEPGLPEMIHRHQRTGQLTFTDTAAPCFAESGAVFLCLPTPARVDGSADLAVQVADAAVGTVDLDDAVTAPAQERGQSGTVRYCDETWCIRLL